MRGIFMEELMWEITKTGCITLMSSAMVKALGQKETSDIIKAAGISVIGIQTLEALKKMIISIKKFSDAVDGHIDKIGLVLDKLTFWN